MKNTTLNKCEKLKDIRTIKANLTGNYGKAEITVEFKWLFARATKTVEIDRDLALKILDQAEKELEQEIKEEVLNDEVEDITDIDIGLTLPKAIERIQKSQVKKHE